jgi:hypothetical protein
LRRLTLKDTITSLSRVAQNCPNLERIVWPTNLISIDGSAFHSSGFSKAVVLPEGLTTIGGSAFNSVNAAFIYSIVLPSTITSLGTYSLYAKNAKYYVCKATTPPSISTYTFQSTGSIYVPDESVSAYKTAETWATRYSNRIKSFTEFIAAFPEDAEELGLV